MPDAMIPLRNAEFDWADQALCKGTSPTLFFPDDKANGSAVYITARTICAECEVSWECLQFAVENGIKDGMWGGRSPNERRGMREVNSMTDVSVLLATEKVVERYRSMGLSDFLVQAGGELGLSRLSIRRRMLRLKNLREKEERNVNN